MRHNFIGGSSTTGGTGALTLSAAGGLALPATAFVSNQPIEYSIVEYTDATLAVVSKAETGIGTISAGNILSRVAPRSSWDGTTYVQTGVSALSFGTANVRVYCSPTAEGGPTSFPANPTFDAYGPSVNFNTAANVYRDTDVSSASLLAGRVYLNPIRLEAGYPITKLAAFVTTAGAGGTTLNLAIVANNPVNGRMGRILCAANGLDASTTGQKTGTITGTMLAPGWYWSAMSASANIDVSGVGQTTATPIGALANLNGRQLRYLHRARTFADFVAGNDLYSEFSGSWAAVNNLPTPLIGFQ